jgi:hypothetical protein
MKIRLLHPEEVLKDWLVLSPLIQEALDKGQGENTLLDHMKKLLNFNSHCWVIKDKEEIKGVILTEFLQYTQHRTLHIITLSGTEFETWVHLYPTIEQFAKEAGCIRCEIWGRAGWAKVLPKVLPGFEQAYVVMSKNIGE